MISAFKNIRLSGYSLTPVSGTPSWNGESLLRLGFGGSGLAYYSDLVGISGALNNLINVANADVSSLNNLQDNVKITGGNGISILVDSNTNEITISGNNTLVNHLITGLSGAFDAKISDLHAETVALSGEFDNKITTTYVRKASQQAFTTPLTQGTDAYAVFYPVTFTTTPKVQATLEVDGNVTYNLSIRNIGTAGYTGLLSDDLAEPNAKIHTFASVQQNPAVAD